MANVNRIFEKKLTITNDSKEGQPAVSGARVRLIINAHIVVTSTTKTGGTLGKKETRRLRS
jgi:hypothetical protein